MKEALEEEALPACRIWAREAAAMGKIPKEMLERVHEDALKHVRTDERDALLRKVCRMVIWLSTNRPPKGDRSEGF